MRDPTNGGVASSRCLSRPSMVRRNVEVWGSDVIETILPAIFIDIIEVAIVGRVKACLNRGQ